MSSSCFPFSFSIELLLSYLCRLVVFSLPAERDKDNRKIEKQRKGKDKKTEG
jgi:hypothetical protein